ncbi:MAG: DUF1223 domain-containing protein [Alphaproteobacteria bacterium]
MKHFAVLLGLAALALAAPAAVAQQAQAQQDRPVVVELFTSQGCSSCPPADRVVEGLADREDVIALSFNVDYWDYIGWKDTLASPDYTRRQYAYADAMDERRVYTPQIVIDGVMHVVGSDSRGVDNGIKQRQKAHATLPVSLESVGGKVVLKVGAGAASGPATIWLVQYDNRQDVAIGRGENAGRTITYANVARTLVRLGEWTGAPMELSLDAPVHDGCVVLVQQGTHGPILGAARLRVTASAS